MMEDLTSEEKMMIAELKNEIEILRRETFTQARILHEQQKEINRLVSLFINMKKIK